MVPSEPRGVVRSMAPIVGAIAPAAVVSAVAVWLVLHVVVQLLIVALLPLVLTGFLDVALSRDGRGTGLSATYLRFVLGCMRMTVGTSLALVRVVGMRLMGTPPRRRRP